MSLQLFKPNAKNLGHLIGLSFNSKEGKLYAQFVKQTGWDAGSHRGSFKGGAKFNITLNATEIGGILNVIERGTTEKLFHKSEKGSTSIELKPYEVKSQDPNVKPVRNGFTISVSPRGGAETEKPLTFGFWFDGREQRLLKEYLQFVLDHFFSAAYSADKKRREEAFKERGAAPKEEPAAEPESAPEPEFDPFA